MVSRLSATSTLHSLQFIHQSYETRQVLDLPTTILADSECHAIINGCASSAVGDVTTSETGETRAASSNSTMARLEARVEARLTWAGRLCCSALPLPGGPPGSDELVAAGPQVSAADGTTAAPVGATASATASAWSTTSAA